MRKRRATIFKRLGFIATLFVLLAPLALQAASLERSIFITDNAIGLIGAEAAESVAMPALRLEYEAAVKGLAKREAALRAGGASPEEIARELSAARRARGVEYKALTPAEKLSEIYARNLEKYGDKLGPTVDWLRARVKSWDDIIESAKRPGGQDLKF